MRGFAVKTPERVAEARRLREQGQTLAQIGERYGVSHNTISTWLNDPDGTRMAARRAKSARACAGRCGVCGAQTHGSRGRINAPDHCPTCSTEERTTWTRDAIILAIQEWAAKYGEPPSSPDWNDWQARNELHDEERVRRYERERAAGTCPCHKTVHRVFGSWNAAIEAAGFQPRAAHGGGGNEQRRRSMRAKAKT